MQQQPALKTAYQAHILMEFKEQITIYLCYKVKTCILVPEEGEVRPFSPSIILMSSLHSSLFHISEFSSSLLEKLPLNISAALCSS